MSVAARPRIPAVVISIRLEQAAPSFGATWETEADGLRMADWLCVHPELAELLGHALELAEEAKAA